MKNTPRNDWTKEFGLFLQSSVAEPPSSLTNLIANEVRKALNPNRWAVFFKLFVVHLFSGCVTLIFCPQFGVGPFGGGHGLMAVFMQGGSLICGVSCGAFFMGTTALASQFIMGREERRVVYKNGLWQFSLLSFLSVGALMILGKVSGGNMHDDSTEFLGFWILGGILFAQGIVSAFRLRIHSLR